MGMAKDSPAAILDESLPISVENTRLNGPGTSDKTTSLASKIQLLATVLQGPVDLSLSRMQNVYWTTVMLSTWSSP